MWRYTSPELNGSGVDILYECPVGLILREGPQIYDAIEVANLSENMTPTEMRRLPVYMTGVMRLVASERSRLRDIKDRQEIAKRNSEYGMRRRNG